MEYRRLDEVLDLIIDHRGVTATKLGGEWKDEGIPVISANNLRDGQFVEMDSLKHITKELFNKWMRTELQQGDVLLVSEGATFGQTLYLRSQIQAALGQRLFALRCNDSYLGRYLYYYLKSKTGQNELKSRITGTSVSGIRQSELTQIRVPNTSKSVQKAISDILGSIDDKILLNCEMTKTLEAIGQAIFKHWFIDFEFPNEKGKPYKSSGGEMVYDEEVGKEIPKGWRVKSLNEISDNSDSKRVPLSSRERESRKGVYPYYGATGVLDHVNDFIFDGTFVLMGEDGSVIDQMGHPVLQYVWGKFWVNNHAHVLRGKSISSELLYMFLRNINVDHIVTGAVQPKINQDNMNRLKFGLPSQDILKQNENGLESLFGKLRLNVDEIRNLSQIRDSLIPKLMSEKIGVKAR